MLLNSQCLTELCCTCEQQARNEGILDDWRGGLCAVYFCAARNQSLGANFPTTRCH